MPRGEGPATATRGGGRGPSAATVLAAVLGVATGLALALSVLVPAGLPYDEPAHWANVTFILHQHRLPVLGDPGVQYEAQMGPVYYALSAVVVRAAWWLQDPASQFHLVRSLWVVLVPVLGVLSYRLSRRLRVGRRGAALAAALVALNPSLLTVGSTIQNDYLAIVLATAATLLAAQLLAVRLPGAPSARIAGFLGVGALIGLATLTKVFAGGVLVGLAVALVTARREPLGTRVRAITAAVVGFLAVSGWWFARNLVLYGDLTGRAGVRASGTEFPPLAWTGPESLLSWVRNLVAYAFVPTEYLRNVLDAPAWVRLAAGVLCVALAAVVLTSLVRRRRTLPAPAWVLVLTTSAVTLVGYAVSAWTVQGVAPRVAFIVAPHLAALLGWAARSRAAVAVTLATVAVFGATDLWLLGQVSGVELGPWALFASGSG